jgi:nitrogen PTS system EIIA component
LGRALFLIYSRGAASISNLYTAKLTQRQWFGRSITTQRSTASAIGAVIMEIADFIAPAQVAVDFRAENKEALLIELARHSGAVLKLTPEGITAALLNREHLGTTGTGQGVAFPHARLLDLRKPFAMLVRLTRAIDFGAVDGAPVDVICLLLLPENPQGGWLSALSCFTRALRDEAIVRAVREARDSWGAYRALLGDVSGGKAA